MTRLDEVRDFFGVSNGADHAVAAIQELLGELTAKAAADSGDKPCALFHSKFHFCVNGHCAVAVALVMFVSGTTSSIARSALSVRG